MFPKAFINCFHWIFFFFFLRKAFIGINFIDTYELIFVFIFFTFFINHHPIHFTVYFFFFGPMFVMTRHEFYAFGHFAIFLGIE